MWHNYDLPFDPREIKSWWVSNPILKRQEEIDLVAVNFENTKVIVGECKWRNPDKLIVEMLQTLIQRANLLPVNTQKYLYFFVKYANQEFVEQARKSNIKVIQYVNFFD